MSIFSKVGDFFKGLLFPKLKVFLGKVFTAAVSAAMAEVQDVVASTVKELSYENITNSEKRTEAYKRVVAELKANGKEIKENVIRATIELAVLEIKQSSGIEEK